MRPRLLVLLAVAAAMPVLADSQPHAPAGAPDEMMYAKTDDGYLGMRLEAGGMEVTVLDADKRPLAIKEGAATMFLTYVEDGHRSKVDLTLESEAGASVFKAPLPEEGHGRTKAVAKVTADGKSRQGSFEFEMPKTEE